MRLKRKLVKCKRCGSYTAGMVDRIEKCGGCDGTDLEDMPADTELSWAVRHCPVCGATKVVHYEHEFTMCEGPHMGPFPTDRSHVITSTILLRLEQANEVNYNGMVAPDWCHVHPDRAAVCELPETGELLCAQCQYEFYWRPSLTRLGAWLG